MEMDKEYREMVLWYCRAGHLDNFSDMTEKKKNLQEKYIPIAKYQNKKWIEVHGEKDLREYLRIEYDKMNMQTEHQYHLGNQSKWIDETKCYFKDEADVENWRDLLAKTEVCWKEKGGSFLVS